MNVLAKRLLEQPLRFIIVAMFCSCLVPQSAPGQIVSDWFSGPGIWRDANNWDNGVVPDNNAPDYYHAAIDSNAGILSVVRLISTDYFVVDRLTLDAIDELVLEGNSRLQVEHNAGRPMSGVISNSGTIFLSSDIGTGFSQLYIETDVSLLGGGSIVMSGDNAFIHDVFAPALGHLTNEDNVIQGVGKLGNDRLRLTNAGMGLIHANTDGGILRVQPRESMINQGIMQASAGGILELAGHLPPVVIDNSGGTIQAFENTSVDLVQFVSISGGLLQGIVTGKIRVPSGTATIADATIDNVHVENNSNLLLNGIISNGSLFINDTAAGGFARVIVDGETTLTGNGTVTMNGLDARLGGSSTNIGHLTNMNNTIAGQGYIGSQMQMTNMAEGVIEANVDGGILQIETRNGVDLINDGVMRATNGGTLRIIGFAGIFDNANGQIVADDNSCVDFDSTNLFIIGGDLLAGGTGIFKTGDFTTVRLQDLNLAAPFQIDNNANLSLIGTIHNSEIHINGQTAASSNLVINSDVTLDGNSVINMNGPGARILTQSGAANDGRLTNVNNLIRGQGSLGGGRMKLTNQIDGMIESDVEGAILQICTINGADIVNDGVMRATNGGTLRIVGFAGIFDNANGQIVADDNSCVDFESTDLFIIGGDLLANGSGIFKTNDFVTVRLQDLNLAAPFQIDDNANLSLIGTIHNSEIHINGQTAASSNLVINSDVTLDGNSVINMNGPGARIWTQSGAANNGRLTNVNNTIRGQGTLGNNRLRLTNQANGVIDADVNGETLIVHTVFGDTAFNQGIMQASNGGILQVNGFGGGTEFDNTGGTIQAIENSIVKLQDSLILNGGLLASFGTSQIQTPQFESASLKNITIEGEWIHSGAIILRGPVENNARIVFDLPTATLQVANDLPVVVSGTGSIKLADVGHRMLGVTGNQGFNMTGGVLTGVGQIQVDTQFSGDATVAPGNSIGTLFFNSNNVHQFVDGASIEIELGSTSGTPGVDWDYLDITGNGTLDFDDDVLPSGVTIKLVTLDGDGDPGPLASFDPDEDFSIEIAIASSITGFNSSDFTIDVSDFTNPAGGTFCAAVDDSTLDTLRVNYFALLLGDLNGDCAVNLLDVAPFVNAISTGTFVPQADINQDGFVNLLDVAPFVILLSE